MKCCSCYTMLRILCLLPLAVGVLGAPQTVYITNQSPSNLYINTAQGKTHITTTGINGTSDIIQLVLYPTDEQSKSPQNAVVILQGSITGILKFTQENPPVGSTKIEGQITGLKPGLHGFHVHETGNLTTGCPSTGGHYNPFERTHGSPDSKLRHVGDLGNIMADVLGTAIVKKTDRQVTLVGPNSVIGRAVVVHAGRDDLGLGGDSGSLATGNAGARVGCGVIGRA